jgi:hypothetical protein
MSALCEREQRSHELHAVAPREGPPGGAGGREGGAFPSRISPATAAGRAPAGGAGNFLACW